MHYTQLGRTGLKTLGYFLATSSIAVIIGLILNHIDSQFPVLLLTMSRFGIILLPAKIQRQVCPRKVISV